MRFSPFPSIAQGYSRRQNEAHDTDFAKPGAARSGCRTGTGKGAPVAAHEGHCPGGLAAGCGPARAQPLFRAAGRLGLGRCICRGSHRGCAGGLVCRGGAVPSSHGPADSTYGHHSAQPAAHCRQSGAFRARQVSGQGGAAAADCSVQSSAAHRRVPEPAGTRRLSGDAAAQLGAPVAGGAGRPCHRARPAGHRQTPAA